jgi:hypothetical protein
MESYSGLKGKSRYIIQGVCQFLQPFEQQIQLYRYSGGIAEPDSVIHFVFQDLECIEPLDKRFAQPELSRQFIFIYIA